MHNHSSLVRHASFAFAALFATGLAGCGSDIENIVPVVGTVITANTGTDLQTGTVGAALGQAISVHVADANGTAASGATVTFAMTGGAGSVDNTTAVTDASGNASVHWTLGTVAGANTLIASLAGGASITISATGTAGAAAGLSIVSGNTQTIAVGSVSAPLVVRVADANGNGVAGVVVNYTTTGGTLSAAAATTDASGNASVTLTAGATADAYTVTAASGSLTSTTFVVTSM